MRSLDFSLPSVVALISGVLLANCETAVCTLAAVMPVQTAATGSSSGANQDPSSRLQPNPLESTNALRSFLATGVIRELPVGGRTLVIRHEEIRDFMPKMT